MIVKPNHEYVESSDYIFKGLRKMGEVVLAFEKIKKSFNSKTVWVETDNRSFMSPKRQKVIFQSAQKLLEKMTSLCPGCQCPGFGMTDFLKGLVCNGCAMKSDKPLKEVWTCPRATCNYHEVMDRSDGIKELDPAECYWCNP